MLHAKRLTVTVTLDAFHLLYNVALPRHVPRPKLWMLKAPSCCELEAVVWPAWLRISPLSELAAISVE